MKNSNKFTFEFVETIPRKLEENVLYISTEFETATHLCACGCKAKVVTPLSPSGWTLSYNGVSISLSPSIGNWSLECQSHYFIKKNKIVWSDKWDDEQIEATRRFRKIDRETENDKISSQSDQEIQAESISEKNNWFLGLFKSFFKS